MPVHITPQCNMAEVCLKPFQKTVGNSTPAWSQNSLNSCFCVCVCETPISNTNSTFFFCFVFCVTRSPAACVILYPYESKRLCTTEKSCSSRAVLNQGTLGGLCSISQVKDGTVQNYLIQRWGLPETLGTRVLFWINFLSLYVQKPLIVTKFSAV